MDDLISRQAAIDTLRKKQDNGKGDISRFYNTIIQHDIEAIMALPSAQPEPLKIDLSGYSKEDWERFRKEWANVPIMAQPETGKWISADAIFGGVPFYCSECGENTRDTVMGKPRWKFCPMCGAKMEGADDE